MRHRDATLSGAASQPRSLCSPLDNLSSQASLARNLFHVPSHPMSQDTTRGPFPRWLTKGDRPPIWQLGLPPARPKMNRSTAYALVLRRALFGRRHLERWRDGGRDGGLNRRHLGRFGRGWRGGRASIFLPQGTSLHTGIALGSWSTVYHTPLFPTNWNHRYPPKFY